MLLRKRFLILLSILFFLHALEELATKFYEIDGLTQYLSQVAGVNALVVFLIAQLILSTILIALVIGSKFTRLLEVIVGLALILELSHLWEAIKIGSYYPGLITSLLLVLMLPSYWLRVIKNKIRTALQDAPRPSRAAASDDDEVTVMPQLTNLGLIRGRFSSPGSKRTVPVDIPVDNLAVSQGN